MEILSGEIVRLAHQLREDVQPLGRGAETHRRAVTRPAPLRRCFLPAIAATLAAVRARIILIAAEAMVAALAVTGWWGA